MGKILMIYDLKGKDSERIQLNRGLFCYRIQSHHGKYKRVSKGILKIYEKPVRSVVIFGKDYLGKVKRLMSSFKAKCKFYEIFREIK